MKENGDLQEWLLLYDTPVIPEHQIRALISAGQEYMDSAAFTTPLQSILLSQLQYFPLSFWLLQAALAVTAAALACLSGHRGVPLRYPLTGLAVMIPLLVLVGAREISKSSICDMWEIEQSSRCQLVKITACRMLIIGLVDLFVITGILMAVSFYYQQTLLEMILYGMVPFHISCACYLSTIRRNEKGQISYHLFACMLCMAAVFSILLKQEILFEASMTWAWAAFYLLSLLLLGKTVRTFLEHEKMTGESVWNLQ